MELSGVLPGASLHLQMYSSYSGLDSHSRGVDYLHYTKETRVEYQHQKAWSWNRLQQRFYHYPLHFHYQAFVQTIIFYSKVL